MHYNRIRRNGHLDLLPVRKRGTCTVDGCTSPDKGPHGLCGMHRERVRKHGDPHIVLAGPREQNPNWRGDSIKYRAAHERLRVERGRAADYECTDCGRPAAHWSYNHTDPDELTEKGWPFSPSPEHYSPRCVPCHKTFDLASGHAVA